MEKNKEIKRKLALSKYGEKNPTKQKDVQEKLLFHNLKYIYHAKFGDKDFFGIWDLKEFCRKHKLKFQTIRSYFCFTDKVELFGWIFTREERHRFDWKFYSNYKCEFWPCHKYNQINCRMCYCPIFWHCGTRLGGMDCSNCLFPHDPKMNDAMQECIKTLYNKHKPLST